MSTQVIKLVFNKPNTHILMFNVQDVDLFEARPKHINIKLNGGRSIEELKEYHQKGNYYKVPIKVFKWSGLQ